jgi:prephenate dehydrogenase
MNTIAFLGYGRFGASLGALLMEAGITVRGLDPHAHVPDEARRDSLPDLVTGADLVVVAVPVREMRASFEAIRPLLTPAQIVIDVGSVKHGPAHAMTEVFGDAVPWVATHPLFGPASLARGERPLRAIVCPNSLHPGAVHAVVDLFERIGCEVIEQTPEAHDRAMAYTHALTFFVAKGLLDAGAPTHAPFTPPSFQAIARTIELVRSDAGHLFEALHVENTFAAGARRALLDALTAVDHDLYRLEDEPQHAPRPPRDPIAAEPTTDPAAPPTADLLAIPDLGARSPELREARELIDDLDEELVTLLARRAVLARRAARAKAEIGHGVRDPQREARLLEQRRRWAEERGLEPAAVISIFEAILGFSRQLQEPSQKDAT